MEILEIKKRPSGEAELVTSLQDEPFIADADTLLEAGILRSGAYDEAAFFDLMERSNARRALRALMAILERASKTERELMVRLRQKGFDEPAIEAAIQKARDYRLVDDRDYALRFARDRLERKGIGAQGIRFELQRRGVSAQLIDEALDALEPDEQLDRARQHVPALQRKYAGLPARDARAKAGQFLRRKGFDWDTIQSALQDWQDEEEY